VCRDTDLNSKSSEFGGRSHSVWSEDSLNDPTEGVKEGQEKAIVKGSS